MADLDDVPEPTKAESSIIRPIGKDVVHRICSGQVVLSLAIAVKELVENSIDAGATLVEVKLREQGLEAVEVSDNGCGVAECNLTALTAKYYTSKIRDYDDLLTVETFGFRGEALSSLCALADVTIITRHKNTDIAVKIELDHDGNITKRMPCSRSVGTTVTLTNLFVTLPVRRRDFTYNIKREFTKMCHMLQAYCLVSKGVRLICSNHTLKTGKTVVMQTHGSQDVMANITAVFGVRQGGYLLPIKAAFDDDGLVTTESLQNELESSINDDSKTDLQLTDDDLERIKAGKFQFDGLISSCSHGAGRSSKDRQFYFVNSRPCDPTSISKVVNEIYHRYNAHQFPFVYLNIITLRADIDINLTPDKRQLLIKNEKILLFLIKKSLLNTFGSVPSQYKIQNPSVASIFKVEAKTEVIDDEEVEKEAPSKAELDDIDADVPISTSQKFMDVLSQWRRTGDTRGPAPPTRVTTKRKGTSEIEARTLKMKKMQEYLNHELASTSKENRQLMASYKSDSESEDEANASNVSAANDSFPCIETLNKASKEYDLINSAPTVERIDCKVSAPMLKPFLSFINTKPRNECSDGESLPATQESVLSNQTDETNLPTTQDTDSDFEDILLNSSIMSTNKTVQLDDDYTEFESQLEKETCATLKTSIDEIAQQLEAEEAFMNEQRTKAKLKRLRFKSEINPSQNKNAEAELQTEISKTDFARMDILGQFNLGFVIVKLDTDLFIVDQHATDEKYNFEKLQQTTTLQNQRLAVPQPLELTVVNEMILIDNLEVFEKNGFKFEIDENAPPMRKVRLICKPYSKNWEFGKEDIDELIFMLQDAPPGSICRPSRVRSMFASRACRKSVMIGQALNKATMQKLITHMGEIEQPWVSEEIYLK